MVSLLGGSDWSDDECGAHDEKRPMLEQRDQFSIQEAESQEPQSKFQSGRRWMNSKFSRVYCALLLLGIVAVASLVLAVFLLVTVKQFGDRLEDANVRGQNALTKALNTLKQHVVGGIPPQLPPNAIHPVALQNLSPEQIAQAKAAGLIPVDATLNPKQNIEPHLSAPHVSGETTWKKDWHDPKCDIRCGKTDVTVPPLIVISLDGFAADYLQRRIVTTLDRMKECGTSAEFMYSSFPTKTFPNHYTLATGLYPESHGIVDNAVFDPLLDSKLVNVKQTNDSRFYLGEPIWSTVERNNHKAACLFWPGCGVPREFMPTYNHKYNKSFSYSERIDTIINWLKLPMQQRPQLIMAYFDQPDSVGHYHKTDEEVNLELVHMEGLLNYFVSTLYSLQWLDCVNIIVVSDHGMHTLQNRNYFSERIDTSGLIVSSGVIGRIHLADSGRSYESVVKPYECENGGRTFRVYNRSTMPVRYHFSATPRVGDAVFEGRPGTTFFQSPEHDSRVTADHGFDYLDELMHAIFFARGPNIQRGKTLEPFQNIELFDFMIASSRCSTNGTFGVLRKAVLNVNSIAPPPQPPLHLMRECSEKVLFVRRELAACKNDAECNQMAKAANSQLERCPIAKGPYGTFHSPDSDFCLVSLCSSAVLSRDAQISKGDTNMLFESLSAEQLKRSNTVSSEEECDFYLSSYETDCERWNLHKTQNQSEDVVYASLALDSENRLNRFYQMQSRLYATFVSGAFSVLQNRTLEYIQKYGRLVAITGTIYDLDTNGVFDSSKGFRGNDAAPTPPPTHVFRILIRCEDSLWQIDGQSCQNPQMTRVLSFVLPNLPHDSNCLAPNDYLLANSARVRDIELLTNIQFFAHRQWFTEELALSLRTHVSQSLWT